MGRGKRGGKGKLRTKRSEKVGKIPYYCTGKFNFTLTSTYESRLRFNFTSKYNKNLMKNDLLRKVATSPLGEVGVLLFRNKPLGWMRFEDIEKMIKDKKMKAGTRFHRPN
eukprot:SAG31_NODE_6149_length_2140_cov_8.579590_1_plen_110_part_00